jgi:hypothetical protein
MDSLAYFALGFSLAVILICKVSLRPNVKKVMKSTGIIKDHKARSPRKLPEVEDYSHREI